MEIQFNYFGNSSSLLIECYDIEFVDEDHNSQSDFRSHFQLIVDKIHRQLMHICFLY